MDIHQLRQDLEEISKRIAPARMVEGEGVTAASVYDFISGKVARPQRAKLEVLDKIRRRFLKKPALPVADASVGAADVPHVSIPLHVLTYWRGRVEEQVNHVTGVASQLNATARSLEALQGMLERATAGMTAFVDSGVLPPAEIVTPSPEEADRAFAALRESMAHPEPERETPRARKRGA